MRHNSHLYKPLAEADATADEVALLAPTETNELVTDPETALTLDVNRMDDEGTDTDVRNDAEEEGLIDGSALIDALAVGQR